MKIQKATRKYEAWLRKQITVNELDLELKHSLMRQGLFSFLRATFYRWIQIWPDVCPQLNSAPTVLAIGDLHVENFGTWRDIEGRLIWGINDFDESCHLPYTLDLVRLAASALIATAENHLAIHGAKACAAIVRGYTDGLKALGRPFILAEEHKWLRDLAHGELRDPVRFWEKMGRLEPAQRIPKGVRVALEHMLPENGIRYRVTHRIAGLGSLGRQRFVAMADWNGGKIAREAKSLLPSASCWVRPSKGESTIWYQTILDTTVRCRDPFVKLQRRWIVRRLAPDCSRIELASLPKVRQEEKLLEAMGWETANVHLGSRRQVKRILRDLSRRGKEWLEPAAKAMVGATADDWADWKC